MKKYVFLFCLTVLAAELSAQTVPVELTDTTQLTDATQMAQPTQTVRVGYYRGNQNTVAGAVDKVTEERMNKGLITSSLDALSGQVAGVQVTTATLWP